jgi:uncharacterized membrane protein YkoI
MNGYHREQITNSSCLLPTKVANGSEPSETKRVVAKEGSVPAHLKTRGSIMPQVLKLSLSAVAGLMLLTAATPAMAYTGQELAKDAKISIKQARAIALKAHPGEITDEELEKERGGSGLRYSFDIKRRGVTQEVGVDARTGRVLENKKEGPHPD